MNLHYLWLTEGLELLAFFVIAPAIAIVIVFRAWRQGQNPNPQPYVTRCVASGAASFLLFWLAKWIDADVRTPQYFLQLACVLLSLMSFGVFMGCGGALLLHTWRWHQRTRLM